MNTIKLAIGIDLGTTNSCVGVWNHSTKTVDIIENEEGMKTTPSVVAFDDKERYIGNSAVRQHIRNPKNTIYEVKRLIGRNFSDKVVQSDMAQWSYEVIELGDDKPQVHVTFKKEDKILQPEQISAMILEKMRQIAQAHVDKTNVSGVSVEITDAVITVPAYFNDGQRQATRDAGYIAGLNVLRIIPEPTAAALAYGLDQIALQQDGDMNVLIFDLGGGTFDVSLLTFNRDDQIFEVRAISGDSHLGGADFDHRLVNYFTHDFCKEHSINIDDFKKSHRAMQKIRMACERAKKVLSSADRTSLEIDSLYNDIDYNPEVTRVQFEEMCKDLFEKCMKPVNQVLYDAFINAEDVNEIVLVGGSTRIPKIQELLRNRFNGKVLCQSINPDEAVAYGAAIQAAILSSDPNDTESCVPDIVLLDVCPLSLGVELVGGLMSTIITRNTTIPTSRSKMFSTSEDNQKSVVIKVYEGERPETANNRLLGTFELNNIQPASRGVPKIEVRFALDADGILTVGANDWSQGEDNMRSTQLVINNDKGRLSEAEIAKMLEDAQKFKEQDDIFQKRVKAKITFENFLYEMRRILTQDTVFMGECTPSELSKLESTFKNEWEWFHQVQQQNITIRPEVYLDKLDVIQKEIVHPIIEAVNARL